MEISNELAEDFASLFRGRADVWGGVEGKCNKEPVTVAHYQAHLEGSTSLGIYPLLDDGTCHFAAIDIDEKDFEKAKAVRNAIYGLSIPAYIAESKSKGYHIYTFALDKFNAREIRLVLNAALNKLGITAEVFPKQDTVSELIPYGNYINLPCFGATRQFITISLKTVPVDDLLSKIKFAPLESIERAIKLFPEAVKTPEPAPVKKRKKGRHKKIPSCIDSILQGVTTPGRDEAAFALARYYLDQMYLPEEVMALLKTWDKRNQPPFNDDHLIEVKVQSAEKGYSFGCGSIKDNPMLAKFCIGEQHCDWIQELNKKRKLLGLLKETTSYETDTHLYEEIIREGQALFVAYEKATGKIDYVPSVDMPDCSIIPIMSDEITYGAIYFPSGVDEYGDTLTLVEEIKKHIYKYDDMKESFLEFSTWYILMTWVNDKLSTVPYLRFRGDTGTGKSRSLDIIGKLCYKPMMLSGAVTPAPIYRLIKRFRGTLILDEADFRDTPEKGEVIIILNCGFERDRPVIRCSKDNPNNLEILPCFGPKVFATRHSFNDIALEARCLSHTMEETDRDDIPPLLGDAFKERTMALRNKLLLWRLRNVGRIDQKAVEDIDLGKLEPRLKQTGLPFALTFKDMPEVLERFRTFLANYQKELIAERAEAEEGRIVYALFKLAANPDFGKDYINSSAISTLLQEDFKMDIKPSPIGKKLRDMNVTVGRRRKGTKQGRFIVWDNKLMRKLLRRYVLEPEEFEQLCSGDIDTQF